MLISRFTAAAARFPGAITALPPWRVLAQVDELVREVLNDLPEEFRRAGEAAVHRSAVVHESAVLAGPVIVSAGCLIGPGAVVRAGTWLGHV